MTDETSLPLCVVLIRNFAALDHLAPLIDRLHESGCCRLRLVDCGYDFDLAEDPLGNHFVNVRSLDTSDVLSVLPPPMRAIALISRQAGKLGRLPSVGNHFLKLRDRLNRRLDRHFRRHSIPSLLGLAPGERIDLLICDRHSGWLLKEIVAHVRQSGGRSLCLPHSVYIWGNRLRDRAMLDPSVHPEDLAPYLFFDRVAVTSEEERRQTPDERDRSRIDVLGSMRFAASWIRRREALLDLDGYRFPEKPGDRVKVLFLSPKVGDNANWQEVVLTQQILSRDGGFAVAFKPPLQSSRAEVRALRKRRLPRVHVVGPEVSTSELVRWADVVMVVSTSVMFEAYAQNKALVYLRYLHFNRYFFEGHPALWTLDTRDDLFAALEHIRRDRSRAPYSEADVDDLFRLTILPPSGRDPVDETAARVEELVAEVAATGSSGIPDRPATAR